MNVLDVMAKTENTRILPIAQVACVSELELVREVSVFVRFQMTSLFERLSTLALEFMTVFAMRMHCLHVGVECGFCFVDFVALVAPEGGACPDVVVEVDFEDFGGSDELSARAFHSRQAIVHSSTVRRQEVHFRELLVADVAFESEANNLEIV